MRRQHRVHLHLLSLWVHPRCNRGPHSPAVLSNTGPVLYVRTIDPPASQADHVRPLRYCATPVIHDRDPCSRQSHLHPQRSRSTGIRVPRGVLFVVNHLVAVYGHLMRNDGGQVHSGG